MGSKNRIYVDITAMHPEVTGSCNLCVVSLPNREKIRFVVDCGLFQEKDYNDLNHTLKFNPENIDFCIITHNHIDHTGRFPYMVRNGFYKEIYTTIDTSKLLPLALYDSYKVLNDIARRNNVKSIYTTNDVENTLNLIKPKKFGETFNVNNYIKITFFNNGHLVGAALTLVQISYPGYESINLLFTGDYNNKNIFFDVQELPKWVLELPITIIQESTYGEMESNETEKSFRSNIWNIAKENGTAVILVFSLGRAQEILYELKCMQESGDLDINIPIYFDGTLAIRYTNLYLAKSLNLKESMLDFMPKNLQIVMAEERVLLLKSTLPKIIVTTSGMGSYGPAQMYLPEYISRKNTLIQFTGYTAEGTLGNRLKNTEYGEIVQVGGMMARKNARVEYTTEFSAHAKADEMIDFLKNFKNLKLVLLNHGQTKTKEIFAKRIINEINPKTVGILGEEYFFRVTPFGLDKTLNTRFK